jgi:hypothetical protein
MVRRQIQKNELLLPKLSPLEQRGMLGSDGGVGLLNILLNSSEVMLDMTRIALHQEHPLWHSKVYPKLHFVLQGPIGYFLWDEIDSAHTKINEGISLALDNFMQFCDVLVRVNYRRVLCFVNARETPGLICSSLAFLCVGFL